MNALAGRRTRAYLLDCIGYVAIAVCEVPIGIAVVKLGWADSRPLVYALSCVPPVLAAVIAARAEASSARATWGKRREGLTVDDALAVTAGQRIAFKRALVRNLVKISLPWQLGHTVAFGAADGGFENLDPVTMGATAALYPLLGVMLWTALRGDGRAVHDRVAGTQVRGSAARDQNATHEPRVTLETESA